jgi:site-specific DNA recombinase
MAKAFEYYATGNYSLTALSEKLYSEGLRGRNGTKVGKSRLEDMLKDPFYYGAMRWKGIVYPNAKHQPLVTKELFDKTRATLSRGDAPFYQKRSFIFSRMISCGECKATIYPEIQKGHIYYSCKHYKTCSQRYMTKEADIEEAVLSVFNLFENITSEEAEQLYQKIRTDHQEESSYKENMLKTHQARYNELQRRLDILYDDRLSMKITQERWEVKQAGIMAEQEEIQSQITSLKNTEAKYFERYINIIDLARRSREIYQKRNPEERRMLLKSIFSNLVIKDKIVSYSLKESVAMIAKRVQEKIDSEKSFEPQNSEAQKRQKGTSVPLHPAMLLG